MLSCSQCQAPAAVTNGFVCMLRSCFVMLGSPCRAQLQLESDLGVTTADADGLTLYRVDVRENFSLNLTTVPSPSLFGSGSTLFVAPLLRLPRCQPIATALEPAGHGCSVCTCMLNSNLVALSLLFHFENMLRCLKRGSQPAQRCKTLQVSIEQLQGGACTCSPKMAQCSL